MAQGDPNRDPNLEWLGYVQPVGLVLSPVILDRYGLVPEEQTRADGDAVAACLAPEGEARALADPWTFFSRILGWREHQVAGLPNGKRLPDGLSVAIDEDTVLDPHWAVIDPEGKPTLLVRIEEPSVAADQRGALAGWEATPHQRFERLLRENEAGVRAGILLTDDQLRLVYAPKGETSGWLTFPLRQLGTLPASPARRSRVAIGGYPMLGGLKLALNAFRLHNDTPERRLPALLKQSRDAQAEVSAKLAEQVLGSLHQLLRGLYAADEARIARLAKDQPDHLYGGLLTVLLRLVFLLYAEDRGLIPSATDEEARQLYRQGYGVRDLHAKLTADAARYPDTMEERRGAWARLLVLFRLVHKGGGGGFIMGRGGDLFDPAIYPFLLGQDTPEDRIAPAAVSDGTILGVLDKLLVLGGERLSYRTLDVEQIGSVYETVMGFTVETMRGPALALRGGKNDKVPVFVDLAELAGLKGSDRQKNLKDHQVKLPDKVAKAVAAAKTQEELEVALKPRVDERASPGAMLAPPGAPLLQPTDERRRTGSHYTPRDLTNPIVEHALEPAFERLGPDAKPEDVLALKLCDPAMGSGAFLVEACRQLAVRLVKAWTRWPEMRPRIPDDEDEELHARRLVAQRCLYGVDKNPRAVELAKLSLWLATLAREHEFTFLDHALKCGDSLVGLTKEQIAATHWDTSKPPTFVGKLVADHLRDAEQGRSRIQAEAEWATEAELRSQLKAVDAKLEVARLIGDGVIAAFFSTDKPRKRTQALVEFQKLVQSNLGSRDWAEKAAWFSDELLMGEHPVRPFHWAIEFPEVFDPKRRDGNPGFDAMVGNPPFMGGTRVTENLGETYSDWLNQLHDGANRRADLIAHFFRRAYSSLRSGGAFGLISTNTIAQGDTQESGLRWLVRHAACIYRCMRRLKWPGEAAVVVSVVHISKGQTRPSLLNERAVSRISAWLTEGELDDLPRRLAANARLAFRGHEIGGRGFLFTADGDNGRSSTFSDMEWLFQVSPESRSIVKPYIGGEEVNTTPDHSAQRYVIDFGNLEEAIAKLTYPEAFGIVERLVRPERMKLLSKGGWSARRAERWWVFAQRADSMEEAIDGMNSVIGICRVSPHMSFTFLDRRQIFSVDLRIIASDRFGDFGVLQCRVHEVWARFFCSSMKDDLRYSPSDCFGNFPRPLEGQSGASISVIGNNYFDHRATLMVARNEGMTKTYNRFHDPDERGEDIMRLRELHAEMDRAVLRAYGWDDLAARAEPIFLDETNEDDHTYQGRLFWPSAFRDEVLARLLALNAQRHAEELRLGLAPGTKGETGEEGEADVEEEEEENARAKA
jgi:hypothetical protein